MVDSIDIVKNLEQEVASRHFRIDSVVFIGHGGQCVYIVETWPLWPVMIFVLNWPQWAQTRAPIWPYWPLMATIGPDLPLLALIRLIGPDCHQKIYPKMPLIRPK